MNELKVRKYTDRDKSSVLSWFKRRNIAFNESYLPKLGFIVPGIAAGFIIQTDNKVCIFEPFISNLNVMAYKRDEALDLIMDTMIKKAKDLGYESAFGFSSHSRMISRAIRHGFYKLEESTTICKDLQ